MRGRIVWVCGKNTSGAKKGGGWELQGVFTSEIKAVKACRDENYFIGSIELNKEYPHETISLPGGYYPLAKKEIEK